jgi:putative flippase GtrA
MKLRSFLMFCVVGGIGFLVDSGILLLLTKSALCMPLLARLISFSCAVTVTWLLNTRLTFLSHRYTFKAFAAYLSANSLGFLFNYVIFAVLNGMLGWSPLLSVAIASACALVLNYLLNLKIVFKHDR